MVIIFGRLTVQHVNLVATLSGFGSRFLQRLLITWILTDPMLLDIHPDMAVFPLLLRDNC